MNTFIVALVAVVATFVTACILFGYSIMSTSPDIIINRIKKKWVKRAAKHLMKKSNCAKQWAYEYAGDLYTAYSHYDYGFDGWQDEPEAVVEEDMQCWGD
jgi:hypothetical protein